MNSKLVVNLLTATLVITPLLVGCKKSPQRPTVIPGIGAQIGDTRTSEPIIPATTPVKTQDDNVNARPTNMNPDGTTPLPPKPLTEYISDNGETFKSQIVYFDFDKSTIKSSEKPKVEEVARRMKGEFLAQGKALRIEGHCDERGTEEYNRALGERRALAVREALIQLGIDANKVETISYGEDRPAVPGHNEAAWSKNRRGVFDLLTPPETTANK